MKVKLNNGKNEYVEVKKHYEYRAMSWIKKRGFKDIHYANVPAFLDTETSHNHDDDNPIGWIYQWCFELNGQYIAGRKPSELFTLFRQLIQEYELCDTRRLLLYIHNASYDLTYLINYLYDIDDTIEILAIDKHKIISLVVSGIEIRCSYKLSNMSLDVYAKKMNTETRKLVGSVDYDLIRYQDTKLTVVDWEYMINDVATMKEAIMKDFDINNDTTATVPLTSTGFVRRDCRRASKKSKTYRDNVFLKSALTVEQYKMCKEEFSGGYSHGNRALAGITLTNKNGKRLKHRDFKSRYPASQQLSYFPLKFKPYYEADTDATKMKLKELLELCRDYCVLCRIVFNDLTLRDNVTAPYLASSKILNLKDVDLYNEAMFKGTDNGKVINARGLVSLTVNEYDLKWILRQYENNGYYIERVDISERHDFPQELRDVIQDYFKIKETLEDGIYRDKSKNKLNGIYGMTATDIVRLKYTYDRDTMKWECVKPTDEYIEEALDKYYRSRNNFLPYQLGCWTTASSRDELFKLIVDVIGYENYIYSDTDSIFYYSDDEIEKRIDEYNAHIRSLCEARDVVVDNIKGSKSYYGTFEDEHEKDGLATFRFLHSKCYGYTTESGKFKLVIAGVTKDNKKLGNERVTKEEELGSLEKLDDDFTFNECGGTTCKYIDHEPTVENINGHITEYSSSAIISSTTKKLGGIVESYMTWSYDEF